MDRTVFLFFYTLGLFLLASDTPLFFFAPFIVITCYKKPLSTCLWLALLCGMIVDLFTAHSRLGLNSINYCVATALLFSQKNRFFEDSITTIPILTLFFSIILTLLQTGVQYSIGHDLHLSASWVFSDLLAMPLADALYAFIAFTLPSLFIPKSKPKRTRLFSLKESPYVR